MNNEEIQSLIKQLKAAGLEEEQIMEVFYETFTDGEMDREDLETLASAMGYELTDDFKNEPTPDPIESKGEVTEEQAEAAKEIEPGQSEEDFKKEIGVDDNEDEEETDDNENNDEDWEKAQKMFKV